MAFDLQRPLDGTTPPGSILEAHHRTALGPAADQPETSGHHGDPHMVQTLQVRAHDTVLVPPQGFWHGTGQARTLFCGLASLDDGPLTMRGERGYGQLSLRMRRRPADRLMGLAPVSGLSHGRKNTLP